MAIRTTMPAPARAGHHEARRYVSGPHRIHQMRQRAGAAYVALPGLVEAQAAALRVHHTTLVHRRQGQGGLANLLIEVDAMERAGIDTTPLLEAVVDVQIAARRTHDGPVDARALAAEEQLEDAAEDVAEVEYLLGVPQGARRWRDRLVRLTTLHARLIRVLDREVAG